ncbi:MAG: sulfatase [Planctomycetota bacterium]
MASRLQGRFGRLARVPLAIAAAAGWGSTQGDGAPRPPSIVVILCDDLGYGDLGCFGHPTIRTPHLDRLAHEGQRWTSFYAAAPMCTPSRAGLLTGRWPIRSGMCSSRRRVLVPTSAGGLPPEEVTIAEALRERGYATACFGKWHLGHGASHRPLAQGFDQFFGTMHSNDMGRTEDAPKGLHAFRDPREVYWRVPLYRDDAMLEPAVEQATLTQRCTDEAVAFVRGAGDRPFFLYVPYHMPHAPQFSAPPFAGRSRRGRYGDAVEEIDASVGRLVAALDQAGRAASTLLVFTSDNGPWRADPEVGGDVGPLRGGKGEVFEGGLRVPTIFWGPGLVRPDTVLDLGSALDLFPTVCGLAGVAPPDERALDGFDLGPVLRGDGASARRHVFYYAGTELCAVRAGAFKAIFVTRATVPAGRASHDPPLLYCLDRDPGERQDVAARHPREVLDLRARWVQQRAIASAPSQLEVR